MEQVGIEILILGMNDCELEPFRRIMARTALTSVLSMHESPRTALTSVLSHIGM